MNHQMDMLQSSLCQAQEENASLQEKVADGSLLGRELAETREKEVHGNLCTLTFALGPLRSYFSCYEQEWQAFI